MYLDENKIVGGIKIGSINLSLLFDEEQKAKVLELKRVLNSIDYKIKIFSIDKPLSLDENINSLNIKIKQESKKEKVQILEEDLNYFYNLNNKRKVASREFYLILEENSSNETLLIQKLNNLSAEFSAIGLNSSIITSETWRELLYIILNPITPLESFKTDISGIEKPFKEKIAPKGLKFNDRDIETSDTYMSVMTIVTYPSIVAPGWLGEVANVNNTRMAMTISPLDSFEISRQLKKSMSETKSKMINISDYNDQILLQNQMSDYVELVNRIDREHEKFTKVTVNFLCYAETRKELEDTIKELKSTLSSYGIYATNLMFEQERSLKMCLPTMYTELEKNYGVDMPMLTTASSFPFIYQNLQDDNGVLIGYDALGSLVLFDLWKRTDKRNNSNAVIIGKSGSGKSTLVKKIIRSEYAKGTKIIAIDPERELKDMCQNLNGKWIDAGTGMSAIINPLEVRKTVTDNDEDEVCSLQSDLTRHFQTFRTFIKYYLQDLTAYELTKIEDALIEIYKDKNIDFQTDLSKLKSIDYPIMQDLYNKLLDMLEKAKEQKESKNVIEALDKICSLMKRVTTTDAPLFNGHSNINVNEDTNFIVLDINSLIDSDSSILKSQFFNILSWAWNEICKSKERVILLCDEAHLIIDPKNTSGIDFLKKSSKCIRKRNGSLIIISQNLIDFTASEIERFGQVIIDNSTYLFIMTQGKKEITAVQKMMNLSESEKQFLTSAGRGQGLLVVGQDTRLPIQVHLRKEEEQLFGRGAGR